MKRDAAAARGGKGTPTTPAISPGLQRIMVVDDEPDLLFVVRRELSEAAPRVKVETYEDPKAALAALRANPPDVLVTDLRMPEISGIELIWWAREVAPSLPIVVVSAYGTPEMREELSRRGSMAFVEKPIKAADLFAAIQRAAARSEQAAADFHGQVHLSGTVDVIQLYAMARSTGRLTIRHQGQHGDLWFDRGEIVHAACEASIGEPAVHELLGWSGGEFVFAEGEPAPEVTIHASWQVVVLEGCRLLDEARRAASALAPDVPAEQASSPITNAAHGPQKGSGREMANVKDALQKLGQIDGYVGSCVVDSNSGMMLGADGGGGVINLEVAAAGNTEVVRAKRKTMSALGLKDSIEDILITLGKQYHLIRPVAAKDGLFLYLVLDKARANLAMGRHQLASVEPELAV